MEAGVSLSLSQDGVHGESRFSALFSLISDPFPRVHGFYGFPDANHFVVSVSVSREHGCSGSSSISFSGSMSFSSVISIPFTREQVFFGGNYGLVSRGAIGAGTLFHELSHKDVDVTHLTNRLATVLLRVDPSRTVGKDRPVSSFIDRGSVEMSLEPCRADLIIAKLTRASSEPGGCIVMPKAWVPDPQSYSMPSPTPTEGSMYSDPGGGFSTEIEIPESWVPDLILVPRASLTMGSTELLSYGSDFPDQSESFDGVGAGAVGFERAQSLVGARDSKIGTSDITIFVTAGDADKGGVAAIDVGGGTVSGLGSMLRVRLDGVGGSRMTRRPAYSLIDLGEMDLLGIRVELVLAYQTGSDSVGCKVTGFVVTMVSDPNSHTKPAPTPMTEMVAKSGGLNLGFLICGMASVSSTFSRAGILTVLTPVVEIPGHSEGLCGDEQGIGPNPVFCVGNGNGGSVQGAGTGDFQNSSDFHNGRNTVGVVCHCLCPGC